MAFLRNRTAPAVFTAVLFGCLGGGDNGGGGGPSLLTMNVVIEVLSIDRAGGTITTRTTEYECEDSLGNPVTTAITVHDTTVDNYQIAGGLLTVWNEVDCEATILNGTSPDIVGTWTATGLDATVPIPASIPHTCVPDTVGGGDGSDSMFQNVQVSYQVTDAQITGTVTGTICLMDFFVAGLDTMIAGATVTQQDCNNATVSAQGQTMSVATSISSVGIAVTMTRNGQSCTMNQYFDAPGSPMPDCAARLAEEQAFEICISGVSPSPALTPMLKSAARKAASLP
jgi:hypothetical protein